MLARGGIEAMNLPALNILPVNAAVVRIPKRVLAEDAVQIDKFFEFRHAGCVGSGLGWDWVFHCKTLVAAAKIGDLGTGFNLRLKLAE
jgi:hypothetical protein